MTVLELKGQMLQLISEVDDRPTLERLLLYLFKVVKKEGVETDEWWDELSPEQQADYDMRRDPSNRKY